MERGTQAGSDHTPSSSLLGLTCSREEEGAEPTGPGLQQGLSELIGLTGSHTSAVPEQASALGHRLGLWSPSWLLWAPCAPPGAPAGFGRSLLLLMAPCVREGTALPVGAAVAVGADTHRGLDLGIPRGADREPGVGLVQVPRYLAVRGRPLEEGSWPTSPAESQLPGLGMWARGGAVREEAGRRYLNEGISKGTDLGPTRGPDDS